MIRTQISLEDEQMERLRRLARRRDVSIAALLREAVDELLAGADDDVRSRARSAVGKHRSGSPGRVSVDHDEALADAFSG